MRIAKLTIDSYSNYGNDLQNYALQKNLMKYADHVDTIWHSPDNFLPRCWGHWTWKDPIKFLLNRYNLRTEICNGHIWREMARQTKFKDWVDRYVNYRIDVKNLADITDQYDYFVVGSDQVWNPYFGNLKDNFLGFVSEEKRISYAASIASPKIPKSKIHVFAEGFKGMKGLSLREADGARIVEEISGRKAEVHVDPTMLLTADEWRKVNRIPAWYKGKDYILTYFLGKRPESTLEELSKKTGLNVINLLDDRNYDYYVTGVDEFLWAIEHAKLVYTDSFHGTVFSILFHVPFVVCNRVGDKVASGMTSRLDTLLGKFELSGRRASRENNYEIKNPFDMPDWEKVDSILNEERKRSDRYLRKVLKK